jgi:hypothetical protein
MPDGKWIKHQPCPSAFRTQNPMVRYAVLGFATINRLLADAFGVERESV